MKDYYKQQVEMYLRTDMKHKPKAKSLINLYKKGVLTPMSMIYALESIEGNFLIDINDRQNREMLREDMELVLSKFITDFYSVAERQKTPREKMFIRLWSKMRDRGGKYPYLAEYYLYILHCLSVEGGVPNIIAVGLLTPNIVKLMLGILYEDNSKVDAERIILR